MKVVIGLVLTTLTAAGGAGLWYSYASASNGSSFRTVALERGNLMASIGATGTIQAEEVVDVGAQVAGQIKNFGRDPHDSKKMIDYCTPVEEGTVLAQLDES